ncbi:N/A [soil metagenome]
MPPLSISFRVVAKPILPVADMERAVGFYRQLGFEVEAYDPGYNIVSHSGEEILHLRVVEDLNPASNAASVYFHVQDVDAVHAEWASDGVATDGVVDQPWGMREFTVTDPAGNLIRVGQNN